MYFDRRLWQLTRGLRGRIAAAIVIGLLASAFGIARFALLGEPGAPPPPDIIETVLRDHLQAVETLHEVLR